MNHAASSAASRLMGPEPSASGGYAQEAGFAKSVVQPGTLPATAAMPRGKRSLMRGAAKFWGVGGQQCGTLLPYTSNATMSALGERSNNR